MEERESSFPRANSTDIDRRVLDLCKVSLGVMDEGVHIVDSTGRTVFYNTAMANLEGLDPSLVLGRTIQEVFPNLTDDTSTLLQVLKSQKPIYDYVQTYYTLDGESVTTVNSTIPIVVDGKCQGAVEIAKDISRIEQLAKAVRQLSRLSEAFPLDEVSRDNGTIYSFDHVLGTSETILTAKQLAITASRSDNPVLVYGETGVGKEVFAQSIHNASERSAYRFVAVNCAALPEPLLESTLFGTVRGAFTGALDKSGLFEEAQKGTLFLDELDSMSLALQAKLLRVLEERAIRRVGSTYLTPVDVRIIASLGDDPLDAMECNQLREDLYFRVAVNVIEIPPLRDRGEDIVLLANTFAKRYAMATGQPVPVLKDETLSLFLNYRWPGNVRELKNTVMAITDVCKSPVGVSDLPEHFKRAISRTGVMKSEADYALKVAVDNTELSMIKSSLANTGGNVAAAARLLGISRQSLQYKIKKYGISDLTRT
ncbi:MAG: sigma 54-interacting transcriptional regulator [Firmicutes bacterium]|nr:sigma 54-interacting transcriptional regulator [Candidatus Fermentithermobacillaceae bacterium]